MEVNCEGRNLENPASSETLYGELVASLSRSSDEQRQKFQANKKEKLFFFKIY